MPKEQELAQAKLKTALLEQELTTNNLAIGQTLQEGEEREAGQLADRLTSQNGQPPS